MRRGKAVTWVKGWYQWRTTKQLHRSKHSDQLQTTKQLHWSTPSSQSNLGTMYLYLLLLLYKATFFTCTQINGGLQCEKWTFGLAWIPLYFRQSRRLFSVISFLTNLFGHVIWYRVRQYKYSYPISSIHHVLVRVLPVGNTVQLSVLK